MKCIVIDDEPMAIDVIERYIEKLPSLTLVQSFGDALKALDFLNAHEVDLIFLDINMPDISGIEFLKTLQNPPLVIFTTAYSEYALESYEYESVDYLLKPIAFNRFIKAVQKAHNRFKDQNTEKPVTQTISNTSKEEQKVLFIKSGTAIHRINESDILYIEGAGNYLSVVTQKEKILTLYSMKEMIELLNPDLFLRIHKSYVVSVNQIHKIEKQSVFIYEVEIPIGNTYKELFLQKVKDWTS